jgi:hypothetical protein
VTVVGTVTRGAGQGGLGRPRRVLLLSESAGLAAVLTRLLDPTDRLSRLGSFQELAGGLATADAVVLDVPRADRGDVLEQLRWRYQGPLVVLVARGDDGGDLPPDAALRLLPRPFSADELRAALAMATDSAWDPAALLEPPPAPPPADPPTAPPRGRPRRRAGLAPLLAWLAHGWRARRRVRVAGVVGLAATAFTITFALAVQGRCGPACDLLGTGVVPAPTIAVEEPGAPTTVRQRRAPTSTAVAATVPGTGIFPGSSATVLGSTSTTERPVPTTTRAPGGVTTRPPTTSPPTTPTTGPTTTDTTETTTTDTTLLP